MRRSWKSQEEFIAHVAASWPEYNRRYAHPFEWTWINQKCVNGLRNMLDEFRALLMAGDIRTTIRLSSSSKV
jgi:hypothetical protein